MPLMYEPSGKAREYSPLALNHWTGCDHGCQYCYVPAMMLRYRPEYRHDQPNPRDILADLERELAKPGGPPRKQVLLSFTGDPYCQAEEKAGHTRKVLELLLRYGCAVAVLTKGGKRCLRDLDLFGWFGLRVKVGATLTFDSPRDSQRWEPGAAPPEDRLDTLKVLHDKGIKTWASFEPVIQPEQTLRLIERTLPYLDQYKIGKWNHDARAKAIDWATFALKAVTLLRKAGKHFYVKADLQEHCPVSLRPEEINADSLALKADEQLALI
jgi:DNA repair photolyase